MIKTIQLRSNPAINCLGVLIARFGNKFEKRNRDKTSYKKSDLIKCIFARLCKLGKTSWIQLDFSGWVQLDLTGPVQLDFIGPVQVDILDQFNWTLLDQFRWGLLVQFYWTSLIQFNFIVLGQLGLPGPIQLDFPGPCSSIGFYCDQLKVQLNLIGIHCDWVNSRTLLDQFKMTLL